MGIGAILLVIALILAVLAAVWQEHFQRVHLGWAAIAFYLAHIAVGILK